MAATTVTKGLQWMAWQPLETHVPGVTMRPATYVLMWYAMLFVMQKWFKQ